MKLEIIEQTDALTRVALEGRLDTAGALDIEKLFTKIVAEPGKPAVVDLAKVPFIASMGMRILISCAQALGRSRGALALLNPQPAVEDSLRLIGLADIIHIVHNEEEAFALLRNGSPPNATK